MDNIWRIVSEKLNEGIFQSGLLIEALLGEENNIEKEHWWDFLAADLSIDVEELRKRTQGIKATSESLIQKEEKYCELLDVPFPKQIHLVGETLINQLNELEIKVPIIYDTIPWKFRWIYTFTDESGCIKRESGLKLSTIKRYHKSEVTKLFKRASYTTSVKDGTPERWSEHLIAVDISILS